jgi:hypothetical protein
MPSLIGSAIWSRCIQDVAGGQMTSEQIAERRGVPRATLEEWRTRDDFRAAVEQVRRQTAEQLQRLGVAAKQNRIDWYNTAVQKLVTVLEDRASDAAARQSEGEKLQPGELTGLLVREDKMVGTGRNAQWVTVYSVDTPTLKEIRATLEQCAKETGQWVQKHEVGGSGTPVRFTISLDTSNGAPGAPGPESGTQVVLDHAVDMLDLEAETPRLEASMEQHGDDSGTASKTDDAGSGRDA